MSPEDLRMSTFEEPTVLESIFDNPASLAAALAETVADDLRAAIKNRGHATLVVSGGTTPQLLLEELSVQLVPWSKVSITLADERWVEASAAASNEGLLRRTLFQHGNNPIFYPIKMPGLDRLGNLEPLEARLGELPRPFDVVLLGLGADGHTASLFPNDPELRAMLQRPERLCWPITAPDGSERVTLTFSALLDSRRIILHFTGDAKWQVYRQALTPGAIEDLPVRAFLGRGREPIDVFWSP
jgi:6-phosphogluconolactonase